MKKILIIFVILIALLPSLSQAQVLKPTYPRLANYFLRWRLSAEEATALAKWDLIILDMENQETSRDQILRIRQLNPQIIILAYITAQEIMTEPASYNDSFLRQELFSNISSVWWLRNADGDRISNWPQTYMLNLSDLAPVNSQGQAYSDYLPEFVSERLVSSGLWDGVFYDNTWGDVSWVTGSLDLNLDRRVENQTETDRAWAAGFTKMLEKTRLLTSSNFIIVGNGRIYNPYQPLLNGMMLENFPSSWENGGTWSGSMSSYSKLPKQNIQPSLPIINVYNSLQSNYRLMRFGLTSTLLGDGFYSYDASVTNHGQLWWYDEYDINLGVAQSPAVNLLGKNNWQASLWRRDFQNGIALVNSTSKTQSYIFYREEFEAINGQQDRVINNGRRLNQITLAPSDGVILWKKNTEIKEQSFTNGYFFRVYNDRGNKPRAGFFSYLANYPGEAEVLVFSDTNNFKNLSLNTASGQLNVNFGTKINAAWRPFGQNYRGPLSLSAKVENNDIKIAIGAGIGSGPQIQFYNGKGKLLSSFFAYDKNLRGGVNVSLADLDGDGQLDFVTGPGKGSEPLVKVFSQNGRLRYSFLVYDAKFKGGVNVAVGDVNADGRLEIVTAPASGGGPQIRIFTANGRNLGNFFAFDQSFHGGIKVTLSDLDDDGRAEILTGLKNFY